MTAGIRALRRAPRASLPLALEGVAGALLVGLGAFPHRGGGATATAAFPADVYFDLKQAIAFGSGWAWVVAAVILSVLIRGAVLGATLWLADGEPGPFVVAWARSCRMVSIAALALFPSVALSFVGAATRYAPFLWISALAGFVPALLLVRRAAKVDVGGGSPPGRGVPEVAGFLAYAYVLSAIAAALSVLGRSSSWSAAALIACMGPLHALFLLGWRQHLREQTYPGGGALAAIATAVAILGLFGASLYDRYIRDSGPVGTVSRSGTLLLLGGVDSTSTSGALVDLDARDIGFARERTRLLSYRAGGTYTADDTRGDLDDVARTMSSQIAGSSPPRYLLGHSQASLIVDELVEAGLMVPDRVVVLAPSLPQPPLVDIPPPDANDPGKPGGDVARGVARLLDLVGIRPFDVDAPASPTNVEPSRPVDDLPRLAIWSLGDSVWLDHDWRRPGEINVVALTDHVGVTNNAETLETARDFFAGRPVTDDETSIEGLLVAAFRYAFEPWRPM